ncbi:transmembrane protein, putative (macronuclear) [Tetrahymena thermophila SB210]|uniref:Transmembrane protein, putative n=1 Tax=Tetrahymena thermophila (strain SB210) TaxID=312017 RepID=W7X5T7_TETTS|nr:transmembrane protein, putative [Tetrahymena thermophila SB210]EWS72762.1 transmembrane protein, putative [Tetrahymena thermophila SB210]|eukprot:XP_012654699.1 transmembrane protein, putative [Tetrahymena thermophila SB210]
MNTFLLQGISIYQIYFILYYFINTLIFQTIYNNIINIYANLLFVHQSINSCLHFILVIVSQFSSLFFIKNLHQCIFLSGTILQVNSFFMCNLSQFSFAQLIRKYIALSITKTLMNLQKFIVRISILTFCFTTQIK